MTDADVVATLREGLRAGVGPELGRLLDDLVDRLAARLENDTDATLAAVRLPILLSRLLAPDRPMSDIVAACAAVFIGARLLDDLMDGDSSWLGADLEPTETVVVAQSCLVSAVEMIGRRGDDRLTHRLRALLAELAEGQLADDRPVTTTTTPSSVAALVEQKGGAMLAGVAGLVALAAADGPSIDETVARAESLGRQLAIARQHANDLREFVSDRVSDRRNQTATLVLALIMDATPVERREALLGELLDERVGPERQRLLGAVAGPAVRDVLTLIELHRRSAQAELDSLGATGQAATAISVILNHTSFNLGGP